MSKLVISKEKVVAVADAVREKTGTSDGYSLDAMPDAIRGIQGGGGADFEISDASYLFYGGARWDYKDVFLNALTDKLTGIKGMFYNCATLQNIDLSRFDTSSITDMSYIFYGCTLLENVEISNLNTSKVTQLSSMFCNCSNLKEIDLSSFDTSRCVTLSQFVMNCSKLKKINLSNFDTARTTDFSNIFSGCKELEEIIGFSATNKSGINIYFPYGTSSAYPAKLKRLVFRTDLPEGTYSIRSAINIKYCAFERTGMVEMFNSLPDISGLSLSASYKKITITGNPCVVDGTLTDDDKAIATNKGWTLVI